MSRSVIKKTPGNGYVKIIIIKNNQFAQQTTHFMMLFKLIKVFIYFIVNII